MKLALAAGSMLLMGIAFSCSIDHRSDELSCTTQNDCPAGRFCQDGFCVGGVGNDGGPNPDGKPNPDAPGCPSQCTSCKQETMECKVDCSISPATCNGMIICPPGWNCTIECSTDNSCRAGIDCQQGASCAINCTGTSTCRNIQCGTGPCATTCAGFDSCRNLQCGDSCQCPVTCLEPSRCENIFCSDFACKDFQTGSCTLNGPTCNTCP
ncbi:MAG TPA: hypothetical protein VFQ53_26835 [Kofleriaceae bacterium]|nr:hypothetical protein [Kofleriaceae bacterium]